MNIAQTRNPSQPMTSDKHLLTGLLLVLSPIILVALGALLG